MLPKLYVIAREYKIMQAGRSTCFAFDNDEVKPGNNEI